MQERITVDYSKDYDMLYAEGRTWDECADIYTDLFERTMQPVLKGCTTWDAAAVYVYSRDGKDVAWFDYENMWGGVYE